MSLEKFLKAFKIDPQWGNMEAPAQNNPEKENPKKQPAKEEGEKKETKFPLSEKE